MSKHWFLDLSKEKQVAYLKKHPNSVYARNNKAHRLQADDTKNIGLDSARKELRALLKSIREMENHDPRKERMKAQARLLKRRIARMKGKGTNSAGTMKKMATVKSPRHHVPKPKVQKSRI